MLLGVMSSDLSIPRPAFAWTKESLKDQKDSVKKVAEINQYWQRRLEEKQRLVAIPGTEEYEYLEKLNKDIREGNSKWKRERSIQQEFKEEVFERQRSKSRKTGLVYRR
jgi:hypothetical protein